MLNKANSLRLSAALFTGLSVFVLSSFSSHEIQGDKAQLRCTGICHGSALSYPDSIVRTAERLQRRLLLSSGETYALDSIAKALQERGNVLEHPITVHVESVDGTNATEWVFNPSAYPWLFTLKEKWHGVSFVLDKDALRLAFEENLFEQAKQVSDVHVSSTERDRHNVLRAEVALARPGFDYDIHTLAEKLHAAALLNQEDISITLPYREPVVTMDMNGERVELTLLALGRSEFSNSPEERIWNVHKAFNERINNVVVPQGERYSFIDTLDVPVTLAKGWKEALGLFGGGTAPTPGGGICQAATTVYRSALLAGLPINYKRNHSVFVDHYEQFGVGLDATIFPGVHDLLFTNDTPGDLLFQAYTEGELAYVAVYGVSDGRTVALDGPYFNTTRPRSKDLYPLDYDQIGWVNTVTYEDGRVRTDPIVATYVTGFLRTVKETYSGTPGTVLLSIPKPGTSVASAEQHDL